MDTAVAEFVSFHSLFHLAYNEVPKKLRPQNAIDAHAYALPKILKRYTHLPPLYLTVDTTLSCFHNVGSFLTKLLNLLTHSEFTLKDSFDDVAKIRTVNIILDRVCNENFVNTILRKETLKKLIKDTCSKIVFTANKKLYQQIDDVSMGSSLGPLIANNIMTALEQKFTKQFIDDKTLTFYGRYVDDTLVVIKREDLNRVHNALNNFDLNLKFSLNTFNNFVSHFLNIEVHPDGLVIYCKPTNTGQYTHYTSFSPWCYKTAWITNIIH